MAKIESEFKELVERHSPEEIIDLLYQNQKVLRRMAEEAVEKESLGKIGYVALASQEQEELLKCLCQKLDIIDDTPTVV